MYNFTAKSCVSLRMAVARRRASRGLFTGVARVTGLVFSNGLLAVVSNK